MVLDSKQTIRCVKCNGLAYKVMLIQNRGYGSDLDCITGNTLLPVCPECAKELKDEWFYEEPTLIDGYAKDYPNEHKIVKFINSLKDYQRNRVLH